MTLTPGHSALGVHFSTTAMNSSFYLGCPIHEKGDLDTPEYALWYLTRVALKHQYGVIAIITLIPALAYIHYQFP